MKSHTLPAISILCVAFGLAGLTAGPQQPGQRGGFSQPRTGRVLRFDTNQGLADVRVEYSTPPPLPTGDDKPCKPQTVTQERPGFVTSLRDGWFDFSGQTIGKREGYVQVPIPSPPPPLYIIYMAPAPTIAGRITDPDGSPLAAAVVQAYRVRYTPLGLTTQWVKSTLTNDLGEYRLFWLPYGRYYVAAGKSRYLLEPWQAIRQTPNLPDSDSMLSTAFYFDARRPGDAKITKLLPMPPPASPAPVVNFFLRDLPRFNFRVRLVADTMPPNANLVVLPYGGDLCAGLDYAIHANGDGTFDVRDAPEGLYNAVAMSGPDTISALIPISVGRNTEELRLAVVPPNKIYGTILFEGAKPGPEAIRVNLTRARSEVSAVSTGWMNPQTYNFTIRGMGPGSYYPTLDLPPGAYVKNIRVMSPDRPAGESDQPWTCNALPISNYSYLDLHGHLQALEIPETLWGNDQGKGSCLSIEVRYSGVVIGRVVSKDPAVCVRRPIPCPVAGAVVVLLPRAAWSREADEGIAPPDRILTTLSAVDGRFEVNGLPDEEYRVLAIRGLDTELIYAPGFYDWFRPFALSIPDPSKCPEYRPATTSFCEVYAPPVSVVAEAANRKSPHDD